jgi:adenosine 3'-phospho 5'-phosphosulfate transporter B2
LNLVIHESEEVLLSNSGVETIELPKSNYKNYFQFFCCFVGLQVSYLLWGVMQERIIKFEYGNDDEKFLFKNSQFLVLSNRLFGLILSIFIMIVFNQRKIARRCKFLAKISSVEEIAPLFVCSYSSLSNVLSSWFQYESLKYVSFTTQLLAKSSKSVFVMLVGRIVSNKRYTVIEYIAVCLIALGLYFFSDVEEAVKGSKLAKMTVTTLPGIICLLLYLLTDSFTSTWQDNLLKTHKMSSIALMCATNVYSCIFTLASIIEQGELHETIKQVFENSDLAWHIILLSLASAIGQLFIFFTIDKYGALVFSLIMTMRQVISIVLSSVLFNHSMTFRNIVGVSLIFFALFLQQFYKMGFGSKSQTNNKNISISKEKKQSSISLRSVSSIN